MPELRWILLGLGIAFCLGLWWWETRRRGQAADTAAESLREYEEPSFTAAPSARASAWDEEPVARHRVEPTFGEAFEPVMFDDPDEPVLDDAFEGEPTVEALEEDADLTADEPPAPPEKIVSMRLFCTPEQPFEGRALVDAMQAEGLEHGQFDIFHKHHDDGRRLFSVASLMEPGSFDLENVDGMPFKGVVFFAVQKESGEDGLADMRRTAQSLAGRLNGNLTAER